MRKIREKFPNVPIIATGGPTRESILATIESGENCISYTPPSTAEIFADIMQGYREQEDVSESVEDHVTILDAIENI